MENLDLKETVTKIERATLADNGKALGSTRQGNFNETWQKNRHYNMLLLNIKSKLSKGLFTFEGHIYRLRLMKPNDLFALVVTLLTWSSHLKFLSIPTPKYVW